MVDIPDPDNIDVTERRRLRTENEDVRFEDDHYLADLYENEYIEDVLVKYKPDFADEEFTESEQDCLKSLPKKTYLLSKEQKFFAFAGLVDILFAYCYNKRANCGEANVESGWTMAKLSSTLSWFDVRTRTIRFLRVEIFRRTGF